MQCMHSLFAASFVRFPGIEVSARSNPYSNSLCFPLPPASPPATCPAATPSEPATTRCFLYMSCTPRPPSSLPSPLACLLLGFCVRPHTPSATYSPPRPPPPCSHQQVGFLEVGCCWKYGIAMVHIEAMAEVQEDVGIRVAAAAGIGGSAACLAGGGRREPERLPCPRCASIDTKFCYYNNYNLQQPRYFCKGCRRYWTRGGALRNVPIGGGTRSKASPAGRRKRSSGSHAHAAAPAPAAVVPLSSTPPLLPPVPPPQPYEMSFVPSLAAMDPDRRLLDLGGSFSSLLAPQPLQHGHYASFVMGGSGLAPSPAPGLPQTPVSQALPEGFWGMGWPDLSI